MRISTKQSLIELKKDENKTLIISNIILSTLIMTPQPQNSEINMFNADAKVVVNVLVPVVAVQFHKECA